MSNNGRDYDEDSFRDAVGEDYEKKAPDFTKTPNVVVGTYRHHQAERPSRQGRLL